MFFQMLIQGPKLESRQLTLSRLVDIGTELAVMGLTVSRVQGELNQGSKKNFKTVNYWLHSTLLRVDGLFKEISSNSDKQARELAKELMANAELLPEVDNSHLEPLKREFGKDLTSGKLAKRERELLTDFDDTNSSNVAK
jgi:hypothetical protein